MLAAITQGGKVKTFLYIGVYYLTYMSYYWISKWLYYTPSVKV